MIIRRNYLERSYIDNFYEKAFSEGYEYAQREFAKKDYEGLDSEEVKVLKEKRSRIAEDLLKNRKSTNRAFINQVSDEVARKEWEKMNPGVSWEERKQVLLERRNKNHSDDLKYFDDLAKKEKSDLIKDRSISAKRISEIIDEVVKDTNRRKKVLKRVGIGSAIVGTIGTGLYLSNKDKEKKEEK